MHGALIHPQLTEIQPISGDDLPDAIERFWSSVWEQGYDPDGRILDRFGDWIIHERQSDGSLRSVQSLREFRSEQR